MSFYPTIGIFFLLTRKSQLILLIQVKRASGLSRVWFALIHKDDGRMAEALRYEAFGDLNETIGLYGLTCCSISKVFRRLLYCLRRNDENSWKVKQTNSWNKMSAVKARNSFSPLSQPWWCGHWGFEGKCVSNFNKNFPLSSYLNLMIHRGSFQPIGLERGEPTKGIVKAAGDFGSPGDGQLSGEHLSHLALTMWLLPLTMWLLPLVQGKTKTFSPVVCSGRQSESSRWFEDKYCKRIELHWASWNALYKWTCPALSKYCKPARHFQLTRRQSHCM